MDEAVRIVGKSIYAGQTTVHPLGLLAVVFLGLCVLLAPRRWSILPLMIMACFVSSAQRIVILSLDFNFLRIMVLFAVFRLLIRKEYAAFTWKPIDKAVVLYTISSFVIYTLRMGTFSAFVNRLGFGFDAFGMYFVFRCLIRDWVDLDRLILGLIIISITVAAFFLIENRTGRNVFSIFGGVSEFTVVREGNLRCQGAFSHAILAGCFWASLTPLFVARWWKSSKDRVWAVTGLVTVSIIVVCCASSTPVMGVIISIFGGLMFFLRRWMRLVRWAILLILIALHIVMQAPVWHLISRVGTVGGSAGWHRYNLINQAINHFSEWWLVGCSGYTVASWGIFRGDMTNHYILEGVTGGFLTLCLFIAVIVVAFREIGCLWRSQIRNPYRLVLSWAMGVSLFVHCTNFIGVAYYGQIIIVWYLSLAMIGSLSIQPGVASVSRVVHSSTLAKC